MTSHLIPERESKQLEFKSTLPSFKKLIKTCVAFANGVGGRIIIGVDDKSRKVIGASLKDRDRCFDDFPNALFDSVSPNLIPQSLLERFLFRLGLSPETISGKMYEVWFTI